MKLRVVLLALVGAAGAMASYALADSGHNGRGHVNAAKEQSCSKAVVFGTAAAPQSFTVTVTHSGPKSPFHTGDVVTVSLGAQGQNVEVAGFGCANGLNLAATMAYVHVHMPRGHEPPPTTTVTTNATTTNGDGHKGKDGKDGGKDGGRGHHDHPPTTTTTATTTTSSNTTTTTGDTTTTTAGTSTTGGDTTTGNTPTTTSSNL